jgi:hypothetical protein
MTATDARRSEPQLLRVPYQSTATGHRREFFLYLPAGYTTEQDVLWPVILFLHGGGERGNGLDDLDYVLYHGPLAEAWIQHHDLPFVLIGPQLPVFDRHEQVQDRAAIPKPARLATPPALRPEDRPPHPMLRAVNPTPALYGITEAWGDEGFPGGWQLCQEELIAILDSVLADYRTDPDRVYLTGRTAGLPSLPSAATPTMRRWLSSPGASCPSGCFTAAAMTSSSPSGLTIWPTRSNAPATTPSASPFTKTSATTAGRASTAGKICTTGSLRTGAGDAAHLL